MLREGGTIFLDEIGALPLSLQAKLLRFLQSREYCPVGSPRRIFADVRVIAATNSDLWQQVQARQFREDLYYRLNILSLHIPRLLSRIEDVPLLANHFIARYASQRNDRRSVSLSPCAIEKLLAHPWPGNVRELEGIIQRAVTLCSSEILESDAIDIPITSPSHLAKPHSLREAKARAVREFERTYLVNLLAVHQGNVTRSAKAAGKERRAFQRLLRRYGVERQSFRKPA